jgi:hypothetical protein
MGRMRMRCIRARGYCPSKVGLISQISANCVDIDGNPRIGVGFDDLIQNKVDKLKLN